MESEDRKPPLSRIVQRVRTQGLAGLADHALKGIVYRGHHYLHDRRYEGEEAVSTSGMVEAADLDVDPDYRRHSSEYLPTPRLLVDWMIQASGASPPDYAFADIGCGRGRVLLTAANYPFREVVGFELSPRLHADAARNVQQGKFRAGQVHALNGDAVEGAWPPGACLFFLFNPFDREVSARFLQRFVGRPRMPVPDQLLLLNFKYDELVDPAEFEEVTPPARLRWALRWLSPYPVAIYRRRPVPGGGPVKADGGDQRA